MNFELLDDEIRQLTALLNNLKKSINKDFKLETLQTKLNYANLLYEHIEFNLIEHEDSLTESELRFLAKAARNAVTDIREILGRKIEDKNRIRVESKSKVTMALPAAAVPVFDIKTATALIQPYDGAPAGLEAFVDSVILLAELTPQVHIATAIKFIKTRLSGKARSALPAQPLTIQAIIDAVQVCKSRETPDTILAKLKATRNKGDRQKFCDEVETLSQQLATLYMGNQIPQAVANKMATKAGTDALISGVQNAE